MHSTRYLVGFLSPVASIHISDVGLILDKSTVLMRRVRSDARSSLAFAEDRDRLLALLSIVARGPVASDMLHHIEAASHHWQRGDKALANLRLVFSGLPYLGDPADADRLKLAAHCLDSGLSPRALMTELGLDTTALDVIKYDPDQPRVPAGSGRASGQFGPGTGAEAFVAPAAAALRSAATSLLDPSLDPALLSRFALLASRLAMPVAILGALLIPTPNSGGVTTGTLPGAKDIRFLRDGPEGILVLATTLADGTDIQVRTESRRGLYVDPTTGSAIGRNLGEQLYLDLAAVHLVLGTEMQAAHKEVPKAWAAIDEDEPKLCPAPTPDTPHHASDRALDYEDDVHARVNPLVPLPRGFGVRVWNASLGRYVYFDDCFRYAGDLIDGNMKIGDLVEAKGPRKEYLYSHEWARSMAEDYTQAVTQAKTADERGVRLKWFYAEKGAADAARKFFEGKGLTSIVVAHMPPKIR